MGRGNGNRRNTQNCCYSIKIFKNKIFILVYPQHAEIYTNTSRQDNFSLALRCLSVQQYTNNKIQAD